MDTNRTDRAKYLIFSRAQIGTMPVKNRIVRSATAMATASEGVPTDETIAIYSELARGGVGLIFTGVMSVSEADATFGRMVFVYDDGQIEGLSRVARAVRQADSDCRILAQIGHSGRDVGPSGVRWPLPLRRKPRELSLDEVDAIVDDFVDAIWRIKTAGFDGVQLHGAHAYLLSSFLSPLTNQRTDRYGGSLEKRVQIIRAILDKARKRVGADFPIMIKLNSDDNVPGGIDPESFPALVEEIVKTGVAAIEVSGNDPMKKGIHRVEAESYFCGAARALNVGVPVILTGGNRSLGHLESLLQSNVIDYVGLSRPLIREPDLPNRWLRGEGEPRAACISCNGCFNMLYRLKAAYCTQLAERNT